MVSQNANRDVLIVGTGYVGLVTAVGLAELGHNVACYDINPERIAQLKNGQPPFYEPQVAGLLTKGIKAEKLSFYTNLQEAYTGQRYIFIGVQTPLGPNGRSDLSILRAAVNSVAEVITGPTLVIVKSTVAIGIFDELRALPAVAKNGQVTFVSCPEFLAEGTAIRDFFRPMRTVVGSDDAAFSEEVAGLFYGLGGKYIITDAKTAQMIKYGANSFLATRVAFINDIAEVCEAFGINVDDVAQALTMDPRVGGTYLSASIGFGGPCLPKDLAALIESSERVGAPTLLLRGAAEHNDDHLRHTIDDIAAQLGDGNTVAVFGLSFKPDTDDVRNSFALKIIASLVQQGAQVRATDPRAIASARHEISDKAVQFFDDPWEAATGSDLQLFLTAWEDYKNLDLHKLGAVARKKNIYDSMHVIPEAAARNHGFVYRAVGSSYGPEGPPAFEITDNPTSVTL